MKFTAASLLALLAVAAGAAGSQAFYSDALVQEALMSAQFEMMVAEKPRLSLRSIFLAGESESESASESASEPESETCCQCVKGSAKWVMEHVIEHIKQACEETKCPKMKEMCEKAAEHPKVTLGYLIAMVRPVSLGYAWCNGKGECGKDSEPYMMVDAEYLLPETMPELQSLAEHEMGPDNSMPELTAGGPDGCVHCIRGTAKAVLWKTVGMIKKFCSKTEDERAQEMCEMAKAHPEEALGFLIYKLRPGEWGCGYCFGAGKCSSAESASMFRSNEVEATLMDDERVSLVYDEAGYAAY